MLALAEQRPSRRSTDMAKILIAGAAGVVGGGVCSLLAKSGHSVRALVRKQDERSKKLSQLGIEVVTGDLLDLYGVHGAVEGCDRIYFGMTVSAPYLEATVNVAAVAKHHGVEAFVNMSQMTVSQMSITSTTDSPQQKQHWLAEQALNWSGLPVIHVRPTAFLESFFMRLSAASIKEHGQIRLPFGSGKTSPVASADVARVVALLLHNPAEHIGHVYELTGPRSQDMNGVAEEFSRALGRSIQYVDIPWEPWRKALEASGQLSTHAVAHLSTMAILKQQNRYDRLSGDVEKLTGSPPLSIHDFVLQHLDVYGGKR